MTIEEDRKEPKTKKKAIKKSSLSSKSKSSKLGKSNTNVEAENKEMENVVVSSAPDTENPSESATQEHIVENVNVENAEPKVDEVEAPKDPMATPDDVPVQEPNVGCFIKFCSIITIYLNKYYCFVSHQNYPKRIYYRKQALKMHLCLQKKQSLKMKLRMTSIQQVKLRQHVHQTRLDLYQMKKTR